MLNIILESKNYKDDIEKYRGNKKFIEYPNSYFDYVKKQEWFEDPFVQQIIEKIDKARVELGFSVRSLETGEGYSVNDLSGGCKFLILAYELRDKLFRITMGENCVMILEQIAAEYEKEGKELTLYCQYDYNFYFKYVKEINFLNYNIICRKGDNLYNKVYDKWIEDIKIREPEKTEEEEEAELEYLSKLMDAQEAEIANHKMRK